jgi:hypothetical protein
LLPQAIRWRDHHNLYAVNGPLLGHYGGAPFTQPLVNWRTLADWERYWSLTDTKSTVIESLRFAHDKKEADLRAKLSKTPEQCSATDFRLAKGGPGQGARKDGKDLGAEVDLVGPGAALERWQKTADYQEWRNGLESFVLKRAPTQESGWAALFNGKDLSGWKTIGGTPATWKVDNGMLRGAGSSGYLVSDKSYGEFHLRAHVRINPGATWGLSFHTDPKSLGKNNEKPRGFGAEFVYRGPTGDVDGHLRMAITFTRDGVPLAKNIVNVKPNDWFPIDVIVMGDTVDIQVPGGGLGGSKLSPSLPPGPIVLHLVHENSAIEFSKIEIKE